MLNQKRKNLLLLIISLGIFSQVVPVWAGEIQNKRSQQSEKIQHSNVPVRDLINNDVKKGMDIDDVVSDMIGGGGNPSLIIYTAAAEGYSAQKIVAGAIKANVPLDTIVKATIMGGADDHLIARGAVDAGVSPEDVAAAISNATSPKAPVYDDVVFDDDGRDEDYDHDIHDTNKTDDKNKELQKTKHASPSHPPHPPHPEHPEHPEHPQHPKK